MVSFPDEPVMVLLTDEPVKVRPEDSADASMFWKPTTAVTSPVV